MTNNSKRLARQRQLRNRTIMVACVTALIAVIIIVMAIKKGNLRKEDTGNASDKNAVQSSSNLGDKDSKNNPNGDENSTNFNSENRSEEGSTSEEETSEDTNAPIDNADFIKYLNYDNPDLSLKGDDLYNSDIFMPANVKDDKYFDTALLIGDSRTEGLGLYCGLANLDIIASKGLTIDDVMGEDVATNSAGEACTIEEFLNEKQYDNIYISFGLNELGWYYYEVFIEEYQEMIATIKQCQPDATIYVENVLPVSAALSEQDEIYNNPNVDKLNKLTKEMCQTYEDIIYLDVASSVKVDGVLPADASTDGRHCNAEYCQKWMDYIRNNVYIRKN